MSYRLDKIQNLIKHEISLIFLFKLQESNFGMITVTNVVVSSDLKIAKIYLSILEKDKRETTLEKVNLKKGFIRSELASRIRMKFVPELKFFLDDTLDYVEKIDRLIKRIHENDNKDNDEYSQP